MKLIVVKDFTRAEPMRDFFTSLLLYLGHFMKDSQWHVKQFWQNFFIYTNFRKPPYNGCNYWSNLFLYRCSRVMVNIKEKNQGVKLLTLTCAVNLLLYLDLWARKCPIDIFIVIANNILAAHLELLEVYLKRCQISMVELFVKIDKD